MIQTLIGLGATSVAGMMIGKVLEESGKFNWAQYINIATSTFLGATAATGIINLLKIVGTL